MNELIMSLAFLLTPLQKGVAIIKDYARDLKAQAAVSDVWNEYVPKKNIIMRRFEDFELKEETRKDFAEMHKQWQTDYEYLVLDFTQHSGRYAEEFQDMLKESLGIIETGILVETDDGEEETDINQELQDAWKHSCEVCRKQKSSVKCEGC